MENKKFYDEFNSIIVEISDAVNEDLLGALVPDTDEEHQIICLEMLKMLLHAVTSTTHSLNKFPKSLDIED